MFALIFLTFSLTFGPSAQPGPRDCWGYYSDGFYNSGLYTIYIKGAAPGGTSVYCDMQFGGGGWTVSGLTTETTLSNNTYYSGFSYIALSVTQ